MKSHEFLQNHSNVTLSKICVYECLMNNICPLTKTVYIVFESTHFWQMAYVPLPPNKYSRIEILNLAHFFSWLQKHRALM